MSDHRQALITYLKTAQLFGEEEFFVSESGPDFSRGDALSSPTSNGRPRSAGRPQWVSPTVSADTSDSVKDRIQELYRRYANCQNCPLSRTRKKIVFGMGTLYPRVLFIGEGPGYEEDRQGLPFVGQAGGLLDRILKAIGMSRDSVYITNIVKCHPLRDPSQPEMRGNDRAPTLEEREACREILEAQIKILLPPIICALGSTAAKTLLKTEKGITHLRGCVHFFQIPDTSRSIPLIATYHPAAVLRNESLKKEVWQDMKLLMKELGIKLPSHRTPRDEG